MEVRWKSANVKGGLIMHLVDSSGETFDYLTGLGVAGPDLTLWPNGVYSFTIASIPAGKYKLLIEPYGKDVSPVKDTSDDYFTITTSSTQPSITVLSPNGGESYKIGEFATIKWTYSPLPPKDFSIILISADQFSPMINSTQTLWTIRHCSSSTSYHQENYPVANQFWYAWKVGYDDYGTNLNLGSEQYKIQLGNCLGEEKADSSDSYFTITAPTTSIACAYSYSDWSACNANGSQSRTLTSSAASGCANAPVLTQSCTYTQQSNPCTFTYSSWSACASNGIQSRNITGMTPSGCNGTPIVTQSCSYSPTSLTVIGPNGGTWFSGQTYTIQWKGASDTGYSIYLSGGGNGANYARLITASSATGSADTVTTAHYTPTSADVVPESSAWTILVCPTGQATNSSLCGRSALLNISAPSSSVCTYSYSDWSACSSSGSQSRTVTGATPSGCSGGTATLTQSCTYTAPVSAVSSPSMKISAVALDNASPVPGANNAIFAKILLDATDSTEDVKVDQITPTFRAISGNASSIFNCRITDSNYNQLSSNSVNPSSFGSYSFNILPSIIVPKSTKTVFLVCNVLGGTTAIGSSYQWSIGSGATAKAYGNNTGINANLTSISSGTPVTITRTGSSDTSSSSQSTLGFSLVSQNENNAGIWNVFGPGNNTGGSPYDWRILATVNVSSAKTISSIDLYNSSYGEQWSTSLSSAYPIVVFQGGVQQNTAYGQTLDIAAGTTNLTLFAQMVNNSLSGAKLVVTFTDGTSLSYPSSVSQSTSTANMASVLESVRLILEGMKKSL
jgi:hypothetical protein